MQRKITIDTAHAEIAREIRLAKKRMFRAHRAGLPLYAVWDAFTSEVEDVVNEQDHQLRGHPPKAERIREATGASPSRERHDLADAVATIIQSDAAPPRLRDAVGDHVTDPGPAEDPATEDPDREDTEEATERARTSERMREQIREIEDLARKAVFCGDRDQQLGLLTLLWKVAHGDAYQLAYNAMLAAFKESGELIDDALEFTVKAAHEQGGDK